MFFDNLRKLKYKYLIFIILTAAFFQVKSQKNDSADFRWGNSFYYNLQVGDVIVFNQVEITLLKIENHYNWLIIGEDTLCLKVARRSVPSEVNGVRVFVADNKAVKSLTADTVVHALLTKDALVCLSELKSPMLNPQQYVFPVSFNDGFLWNAEEDSYPFSIYKTEETAASYSSYPGLGIDLHDARGHSKHWLIAMENSRVVWVEKSNSDSEGNQACVLLKSESQSNIYYLYNRLYSKNLLVRKGQNLKIGDAIGTAWGDNSWGHLHFAVIYSLHEPGFQESFKNLVNGFPQIFGLYFQQGNNFTRFYSRGKIVFGKPGAISGNQLNTSDYESYSGKGWKIGKWNPAGKVESVSLHSDGNVRLKKILFEGTPAQCNNPDDYFEYQIAVKKGSYRIRAKVGDLLLPTWQRLEFEGVYAATINLEAGDFDWTGERIVKVEDGILNIRIYLDNENYRVAGLSEIVFQRTF